MTLRTTCRYESDGWAARKQRPRGSAAQFGQEQEVAEGLLRLGEDRGAGCGREQPVAVENDLQLGLPLGESSHQLRERHVLTVALSQADFFID